MLHKLYDESSTIQILVKSEAADTLRPTAWGVK